MIVERTNTDRYTASGKGPLRPIVVEGWTRRDAIKAFARVLVEQEQEAREVDPFAALLASENPSAFRERNWREVAETICPQEYARQEAMTALSEENDLSTLSPSEREYLQGDMG